MNNPFDWRRGETGRPDPKRLISSLPQGFVLLGPDLTVVSVNPAAEQLIGRGASRLIGRSVNDVIVFEEALILERLADRGAHLVAPGALVRIRGRIEGRAADKWGGRWAGKRGPAEALVLCSGDGQVLRLVGILGLITVDGGGAAAMGWGVGGMFPAWRAAA